MKASIKNGDLAIFQVSVMLLALWWAQDKLNVAFLSGQNYISGINN